jgi:signal transduction histidine kinase
MSQALSTYKQELLNKRNQAILFKQDGSVLESDNHLFELKPKEHLSKLDMFFESLPDIVGEEDRFPLFFPSISIHWKEKPYTVDLHIDQVDQDYLLLIENRSAWYEEFRLMQQERNQRTLENQTLHHKNRNLELEQEILKIKNSEMQRLQDFKSNFFSKVSHELRTPISGIIGLSNLLENVRSNSKDTEKYLKSLRTSASHLENIVNDVLDMSKIESGKFKLNNKPVNLAELIEDIVLSFYYQAKEKGLELKTYVAQSLPDAVMADATRLKQILFNLLNNALKFTHEGHLALHADFEVTESGTYRIVIKIEDTGIGIKPEKIETIFGDYQQADDETQSQYGGTGLGLGVVKHLVSMYGGKIEVSSIPGEGSIFSFDLFLKKAEDSSVSSVFKQKLLYTKLKVLVADDDPINLMIIKRLFEHNAALCTVVNDGENVLTELQKQSYDLLISDVNMPGKTGIELAKALKDDPVKVFLLSGDLIDASNSLIKSGLVQKAFLKPVNPNELFEAINKLF